MTTLPLGGARWHPTMWYPGVLRGAYYIHSSDSRPYQIWGKFGVDIDTWIKETKYSLEHYHLSIILNICFLNFHCSTSLGDILNSSISKSGSILWIWIFETRTHLSQISIWLIWETPHMTYISKSHTLTTHPHVYGSEKFKGIVQ